MPGESEAELDDVIPYLPIGQSLFGLELRQLNEGVIPTEAIALVKGIDADGTPVWCMRYTQGISKVEAIGALRVMGNHEEQVFERAWVIGLMPDEDD